MRAPGAYGQYEPIGQTVALAHLPGGSALLHWPKCRVGGLRRNDQFARGYAIKVSHVPCRGLGWHEHHARSPHGSPHKELVIDPFPAAGDISRIMLEDAVMHGNKRWSMW